MRDSPGASRRSEDFYRTPARESEVEHRIQGSRFIARAFRVSGVADTVERLELVRKTYHDASHHCSAWRLGPDGERFRTDDDGEPAGTAGPPILRRIESSGLLDCLVVVTRYFGGTKLGTGGLVRAYGDSAAEALELAGWATVPLRDRFTIRFEYEDTSAVMRAIDMISGEMVASEYGATTVLQIDVPRSLSSRVEAVFRDATRGRVSPEPVSEQ